MWLASCDLATLLLWNSWNSEFCSTSCDSGAQSNSRRTFELLLHFVPLFPPPCSCLASHVTYHLAHASSPLISLPHLVSRPLPPASPCP